ncbi:malate:quinone oxidoreductase [Emticicia sp. 21SJ11W-3]|uniref:malate:quinone oxidoreductase n=1 Tax=Emticicia sp. 21SJ11W-3 TaxID=2916755 RepID=UPI00209DC03E|nr:malate:quinone oxidoreductase [Emticicia sp. 21SJ11W-3]UTA69311.1 malate:quinone oxidoreductase [Emticicia sp. 21SJ11W-3]
MTSNDSVSDVILIGAGIMSATLGTLLKKLEPEWKIKIFERMDRVTAESSEAWNNAGTGHSAFCELNYTPEKPDGSINIDKAVKIAASFETSKEFWSTLVQEGIINDPGQMIRRIPHMSFVWGNENTVYLKKRYQALRQHHLFKDMEFSDNYDEIKNWTPLIMEGRDKTQQVAATCMEIGTDVNFGAVSRFLFDYLEKSDGVELNLHHEVEDIRRLNNGEWEIEVKNLNTGKEQNHKARFVFIGAGGGSLPLLEKSDIPEGRGYGGFPISGKWLVCNKPDLIEKHCAKVYGKASVGSPPMSVPHLDTRIIDGKKALLFGPFAGFSTRFLKHGSYMDLPHSVKWNNIWPLISAGAHNIPLTKYLIEQVTQSPQDRLEALLDYMPTARLEDWELMTAGQRVQVIKKDEKEGGVLEFGTEVVNAKDGSLATLLGASPGASTAVSIMLDLIKKCFPALEASQKWQSKLQKLIPSYGQSLETDAELALAVRARTTEALRLKEKTFS